MAFIMIQFNVLTQFPVIITFLINPFRFLRNIWGVSERSPPKVKFLFIVWVSVQLPLSWSFSKIQCTIFRRIKFPFRTMASDTRAPVKNGKVREKVALKPGFHLVDWMNLSNRLTSVDKGDAMRKISVSELASHSSEYDCWTAYKGKVYNITQYAAYHPGGSKKLFLGAGKDCTELFDRYHRWVNIESILAKCVVGVLMEEQQKIEEGDEEEEEEGKDEGKSDAKDIERSVNKLSLADSKDDADEKSSHK